jgi:uncharacterized phage protein gp47/JayE
MATNVPDIQFTPAGLVLPAESDVLAGWLADIDSAFGGGTNPALETPQGQLASSGAAIVGDKNDAIAYVVNQVDPATASGRFQDAIARIYYLEREAAAGTVVNVTCVGLVNTVIPVGSLVKDNQGYTYASTVAATIPSTGSIVVPFANLVPGPYPVGGGAISGAPYQAIPGWESATNLAAGVTGRNVESRADFEYRRKQSVALNAVNSLQSIYANVFAVSNVTDVYATENVTSSPITVGSTNYTLVSHSIYVAVVGGAASDIAAAIWAKKPPGADYNGNTSVVVQDMNYSIPYPSYTVKFQIPTTTPILFAVQIANNPALPANIQTLVKNAIINAFAGGDGGQRARIGSTIFASRFYSPISAVDPNVAIISVLLGKTSATLASYTAGIDEVPVVSAANISVSLV